ncbi:MAG: glycine cleavage system protein H [Planctomycetes bacterium]|nr:glycine cleavage system protein H [Planctomycetota bacterium]
MSECLTFQMGKYEARFPADLFYTRNHMWMRTEGRRLVFGLTAYAVRLLKDVYFLDWQTSAPVEVERGQEIGSIESSKALSSIFAPVQGTLLRFNDDLLSDPSAISIDPYGAGWLFEMEGDASVALRPEDYVKFLDAGWEATQRALKKQVQGS